MGERHVVRFEPVGIEVELDEDQTVLRGAAEQGIMLMHGCKEGQCSACKSFLLDGEDVELDSYSTFALPDYEREEGFTLLCRAHVYEDVTIELLNFDEDMIRSGLPIKEAVAEVVASIPVTRDMRHLVLKLTDTDDFKFFPGQYVDITVPGTDETRSFSMANTSARESGQLEFIIKIYPDGLFSHFLDTKLHVGDRLNLTGPFGVFTLRDAPDTDLIFVGGGAGMAPILCLLRSMAERGIDRKAVYYYGARRRGDSLLRRRTAGAGAGTARFPLRTRAVRGGMGRRDRPDHRRRRRQRRQPEPRSCLRVRSAAHGRGRGAAAHQARGAGKACLLGQVHDHRGTVSLT